MNRRLSVSAFSVKASTLATSPISIKVRMTASPAPPCNGPLSAPTPPATAECMSDCVETMQRVVKVDAFSSRSGHGIGRLGLEAEGLDEVGGDLAGRDEREGGLVELGRVRENAVPEQVAHFLEARAPRQVVDVVPTVGEAAVLAVEIAELGLGGDDPLESPDELAAFLVHDR